MAHHLALQQDIQEEVTTQSILCTDQGQRELAAWQNSKKKSSSLRGGHFSDAGSNQIINGTKFDKGML